MEWSHQTVLVTGAGGFIGSHLAERMASLGARTRALIHYNSEGSRQLLAGSEASGDIEFFFGDIRDRDSIGPAVEGVDVIFHLAALVAIPYSYIAPLSFVTTNVEGTLHVLHQALAKEVGLVVHTSTSETYGSAVSVPIAEDHPLQGQSPYAASKIGADKMAEAFHLSFGLPVATVRPFNTYGPRQSSRAVIPTIVTQAITRSEVLLGSLEPTRDLNYVQDTVDGFVRAAETPEAVGRVINLGTGREISIGDLARTILSLLGEDKPVRREERRVRPETGEVMRLCADAGRARSLLGWEPRHTLERGLEKTIAWIRKNVERYRPDDYSI